ncbi:hypothetical protein [Devosia sp.]|uniref:hypothetical protein n=1 Tax=Devosia sp. TaxID=1871048 RepID=UPI003FA5BFE3
MFTEIAEGFKASHPNVFPVIVSLARHEALIMELEDYRSPFCAYLSKRADFDSLPVVKRNAYNPGCVDEELTSELSGAIWNG